MAKCDTCSQEMMDANTTSCTPQFVKIGGKWYRRNNTYYDDAGYDDGDADVYYDDIYDGGSSVTTATIDRPLGVWVPGHWEQQYVVDSEWVWVPGYYTY